MLLKAHILVVLLTCARNKISNFFYNLNSTLIKIHVVCYVRLKSILYNCFDILIQEMIFSKKMIVPFSDY